MAATSRCFCIKLICGNLVGASESLALENFNNNDL